MEFEESMIFLRVINFLETSQKHSTDFSELNHLKFYYTRLMATFYNSKICIIYKVTFQYKFE